MLRKYSNRNSVSKLCISWNIIKKILSDSKFIFNFQERSIYFYGLCSNNLADNKPFLLQGFHDSFISSITEHFLFKLTGTTNMQKMLVEVFQSACSKSIVTAPFAFENSVTCIGTGSGNLYQIFLKKYLVGFRKPLILVPDIFGKVPCRVPSL